jgi:hypothetical protein
MDVFRGLSLDWYKLETVRYMAPERFSANFPPEIDDPSKESDAYSLAMTSFEVCSSVVNCLTVWCDHPVTIRFSQGYCRLVPVKRTT